MSMLRMAYKSLWLAILMSVAIGLTTGNALAEFPSPANDSPANAEPIATTPSILTGSNVNAADTVSTTPLPGLSSVPGPDVFYQFTPTVSGDFWIVLIPWDQVPVYASSGGTVPVPNLCIYVREAGGSSYVAGSDANARGLPDMVIATLSGGVTYEIVVDSTETAPQAQQFEFNLVVAAAPTDDPDDCSGYASISNSLPTAVVNTLTGASHDFSFVEGTGRCDVADPFGTYINGEDHVYEFTTGSSPEDAGDYVFNLIPGGSGWDGYIYITDSCPPFFPLGCLGAASHSSNTIRQAETLVVTLDWDTTYYVYVDSASFVLADASYTLLVDRADEYDISELEPNDSPAEASPTGVVPDGGQILGAADEDYWSIVAGSGDRLYAFVDNGNASLSSLDSEIRLYDTDGTTLLEFDDDDGEGSESPIATLTMRSSSFSAMLAGSPLYSGGTYYLKVDSSSSASTIARYRLHHGLEPGGRMPTPECEPNNTAGMADVGAKEYYFGTITEDGDTDSYLFSAEAGDRVFIALDGDPERNSGGADPDDAWALDGALRVFDPDGDVLISNHNDINDINSTQTPDYPAEGIALVAPVSGIYRVEVSGGEASDYGPTRTYELAIFKNNSAPVLTEDTDPTIDGMTPDYQTDTLLVEASDNNTGDSGICSVSLASGSSNLVIENLVFTQGDGEVTFNIGLINGGMSGEGKVVVTDCAGNTTCEAVYIDAGAPACGGVVAMDGRRHFASTHYPIHVPDNDLEGIVSTIKVGGTGTVADVNVTITIETIRPPDIDVYLESPSGTRVELITDRGGSSSFDITEATFDDDAEDLMPILSSYAPYTGTWLPEDPDGLAQLIGEQADGGWKLNVIDDSASYARGGARLVRWSMDIDAGFASPERFEGTATDTGGIESVVLLNAENMALDLPDDFSPGDLSVDYTLTLVDTSMNGAGSILVTDVSANTCGIEVTLDGVADTHVPDNEGGVTRDIVLQAEVLEDVPGADPEGVVSSVTVPESVVVGEVVADLTVCTLDVGRLAATLTHDDGTAVLINRVGMDERGSVGLVKDNIEITLDDDAAVEDDAHMEPALGTIEFLGLHQPDGRGEFVGDGIDSDYRDNMMFALEGLDSAGQWRLKVADYRIQGAAAAHSVLRRWKARIISPGAAERYVGVVREVYPQAGICSIELSPESTNLAVDATFAPHDREVEYTVSLIDSEAAGSGVLRITDCSGNTKSVPISLNPASRDQSLPVVTGRLDQEKHEYECTATDQAVGDSGIYTIELAPYSDNLQIISTTPNPPAGAGSVEFVIGLVDPEANGRGYVRVTDQVGYRRHMLVHIDALGPVCTGSVGNSKRYTSGHDVPANIPDYSAVGVSSSIAVSDFDLVEDLNLTFNITHPMDDDIELSLTSPTFATFFTDIGGTGNDFIDTTLDDEAEEEIPDSYAAAPFTGSFRPESPATMSFMDGSPAAGTYTLKVVDDANYNVGSLDSWALTIESSTFPERYDGRAEDGTVFDKGLCDVELLAGSVNTVLSVDEFEAGDAIVRYSVELDNPALDGTATIRVTDCEGNYEDTPVCLVAAMPPALFGDLDGSGMVDNADTTLLETCIDGPISGAMEPCDPCRLADFDIDGDVDLQDFAAYQRAFGQ